MWIQRCLSLHSGFPSCLSRVAVGGRAPDAGQHHAGRRRRRPLRWRQVARMATGRHRSMLAARHLSRMAMSASQVQPPRLSFDTGLSTEPPRAALLASTKTLPNHSTTTCCEKPSRCAASRQNVGGVCLSDLCAKHSRPEIESTTQC